MAPKEVASVHTSDTSAKTDAAKKAMTMLVKYILLVRREFMKRYETERMI